MRNLTAGEPDFVFRMKFSNIFTLLLASLAIASPVPHPETEAAEITELTTRATNEDSWAYTKAITAHPGLTKDNYYYFTLEWPIGSIIGDGDKESKAEVTALRQKLGFDHIGLVVGRITETTVNKGKKSEKTKRDFVATVYHMTADAQDKTGQIPRNYGDYYASQTLRWGGATTTKKADKVKSTAKDYVTAHPLYSVDSNNCDTFVTALEAVVR
ncbi:hypothetical protein ACMFMG_003270 [Clarireedia jacksonii]